ncbi:MAG: hypothetical protein AB7D07_08470 [Desulfovibrionaceae bacterium]|jgi:hypothetical protein
MLAMSAFEKFMQPKANFVLNARNRFVQQDKDQDARQSKEGDEGVSQSGIEREPSLQMLVGELRPLLYILQDGGCENWRRVHAALMDEYELLNIIPG